MAVTPDWGDPFTTPPETIPGPSNPWVLCGGAGGTSSNKPELVVPDFDHLEGSTGVNWKLIGGGAVLGVIGLVIVAIGAAFMIEAVAAAIVGATIASIALIIIAALLVAFGGAATLVGGAMMGIGIDPPVVDYARRVLPPTRRQVSIARDAPRELVELLDYIYEVEHLVSGEMDLVDSARAAAANKDEKWYETHVRDLYTVQSRKNHFLRLASESLGTFVLKNQKTLDGIKLDFTVPLRDSINPITELRNEVAELGMNTSEINAIITQARTQSPLMEVNRKNASKMLVDAGGDTAELLKRLAKELQTIECIDWDAFGGKPKN